MHDLQWYQLNYSRILVARSSCVFAPPSLLYFYIINNKNNKNNNKEREREWKNEWEEGRKMCDKKNEEGNNK